jgi:methylenetetrahydrofolate dehydrogenase (NADP+) / methenyltetrahydrofolate cyclohydrolase
MGAQIIDGKAVAARVRARVAEEVKAFTEEHGRPPGLATILVGDDPASAVYVRSKEKACIEAGMKSVVERLPAETTEAELLAHVERCNEDPTIHGILVQMPLP